MKADKHEAVQLGDLVVAAFDRAAQYSSDPRDVSLLATEAVIRVLRRAQRRDSPTGSRLTSDEYEDLRKPA